MATKKEINKFLENILIIFNEDTIERVKKSENEIKLGQIKEAILVNST